ncbi:MAG: M17 family peptidase N-terminal domain-containing protein, partial [Sphingomonas bacterium]
MKIVFAPSRPSDAEAVAFVVKKDDVPAFALPGVDASARAVLAAAATGQRFEGEAGGVAEAYVGEGEGVRRILLLGVGTGDDAAYERAGGALAAKLLTVAKSVTIDLSGSGATAVAAARL